MSSMGNNWFDPFGDDANWGNGIVSSTTGSGVHAPPSSRVGLFGGQYADMMANAARSRLAEQLFGGPADLSGDGTGLRPSVTIAPYLPQLADPASNWWQMPDALRGTAAGSNDPIWGQPPAAIPLATSDSVPNTPEPAHGGFPNLAGSAQASGVSPAKVDPNFIFGEENKPTDDPTKITLPIPDSAKADIKDSIYRNAGLTTWGGNDVGGSTSKEATIQKWKRWGVSDPDIAKMSSMIGLKGADAQAYLDQQTAGGQKTLTIRRASAEAMRRGALNDRIAFIRQKYNEAGPSIPFEKLPGDVQTAIADIAYQTPAIATGAAPNFWRQITTGDWNGAVGNLKNYYGPNAHPTPHDIQRRKAEAGLIQRHLDKSGHLIEEPD